MNVAKFGRGKVPMVMSQLNIRPVFDVNADVQGRDLNSAANDIDKVIAADRPDPSKAIVVTLGGQVETMRESYSGLFSGMALAVVLVYLFLVINFQSWLDPLIVLLAVPFTLGGVMWMLYLSQTHLSVPALMGTLMCIGLTTANSILVVTFANQRMEAGDDSLGRGGGRGIYAVATGAHDRRRDDLGHDTHGARYRRGRRAERAARAGRHRRALFRHIRYIGFRPRHVPASGSPGVRSSQSICGKGFTCSHPMRRPPQQAMARRTKTAVRSDHGYCRNRATVGDCRCRLRGGAVGCFSGRAPYSRPR